MAVVTFNYTTWSQRYPEFGGGIVPEPLASLYFAEACMFLDNTDCGAVPAGAPTYQRDMFLNMITAHIAALNAAIGGQPASPIVGRISQAAQGSVSVTAELVNNPSEQMAFFAQTKYGLAYWTASRQFRTGFYVPGPQAQPGIFGVYNGTPGYMDPFWAGGPWNAGNG